ncbi:MAG: DNA mismatch endonuclease Vsr [Mesorhizobium sp.]|nr:MAG: DNA mismatch endonuclease Vsr [Mesorhizobium sp.]RWK91029.1 MAG: DNA mismatch endonuclease Vsr [Mesorhizobium sp.]TIP17948.1 MAG: DNA mismatch endonuclease Vsr [Mesorhizobium sp.]TJV81349.1 MAG: DNA mismatch endonuclease Vsr [Mesorhizobium sp.]TJW17224.1 MAG: DNA mismatch endonuclease Vsr [Mesorhizobium sp.]
MTDIVDKQTRSRMMAGIRGKDTKPELVLRRALHSCGFRYRLHSKGILGRPDLVFPRFRAAVFVHGCFWHRHPGCRYTTIPATRPEFWQSKFESNIARDHVVYADLLRAGWRVATVWECALRKPDRVSATADLLAVWLRFGGALLEIGEMDVSKKFSDEASARSDAVQERIAARIRSREEDTAPRLDKSVQAGPAEIVGVPLKASASPPSSRTKSNRPKSNP